MQNVWPVGGLAGRPPFYQGEHGEQAMIIWMGQTALTSLFQGRLHLTESVAMAGRGKNLGGAALQLSEQGQRLLIGGQLRQQRLIQGNRNVRKWLGKARTGEATFAARAVDGDPFMDGAEQPGVPGGLRLFMQHG